MRDVKAELGIGAQQPCLPDLTPGPSGRGLLRVRGPWLIAPALLLASAAGVRLVMNGIDGIFGVLFGALLGVGLGWILISVLMPAKADRTCPSCGRKGLERLDPKSTAGLVCRFCEWSDATASSFLLAEEEGPFEDIVLDQRRARDRGPRF